MMKKLLLFISLCLSGVWLHAQTSEDVQFSLETHRGIPIEDGDIFSFGQFGNSHAVLNFYINNYTDHEIPLKIKVTRLKNTDGDKFNLCFGLCFTPVTLGGVYPKGDPVMIKPGLKQGSDGNYFLNYEYKGGKIIEYELLFYQPGRGGVPVGNTVSVTYRYDQSLGIDDAGNILGVEVYPTIVEDRLHVNTPDAMRMKVYNMQGALVKTKSLASGEHTIPMNNLASQIYLIQFENELGQIQTNKVIVK